MYIKNNTFTILFTILLFYSKINSKNINFLIPIKSLNKTENTRNLNILTNNSVKKNLVIGTIINYSWEKIKLYFISLLKAGFKNCDFVMFVGGISNETKSKIKSCGVNVYEIPKEVLRLRTSIINFRWKLYKDFLKENKDKYNMIFTADVRDTIFQKDVFQFYNYDKQFLGVFLEDGLMTSKVNRFWVKQFCDEDEFNKIANETVVCAGTLLGTADKFFEFSYELWYTVKNKGHVIDQGGANYLIYSKKLFNDSVIKYDNHGFVLTIGMSNRKNIVLDNDNNILNYNGQIAAVVHQYDRKHDIVSKLKVKFNDSFLYINNGTIINERKNTLNNFIKSKFVNKFFLIIFFLLFIIASFSIYLLEKRKRKRNLKNFRNIKLKVYQQKEKIKKSYLYKKNEYSLISQ